MKGNVINVMIGNVAGVKRSRAESPRIVYVFQDGPFKIEKSSSRGVGNVEIPFSSSSSCTSSYLLNYNLVWIRHSRRRCQFTSSLLVVHRRPSLAVLLRGAAFCRFEMIQKTNANELL